MLADLFTKSLQGSKFNLFIRVIKVWDDVAMQWDDSYDKYKVSSTYKERVQDKVNNVDVYDGKKYGRANNVDDGHTVIHVDARTWYDVVSRVTIRGRNVRICTY